jgi:transcriptional regulator with XRE-family HTH domain
MITASQCRAARGLLDWTQQELADAARIGVATVRLFESEARGTHHATLAVLKQAFELAGVEFTNGDHPGVRLIKIAVATRRSPPLPKGKRSLQKRTSKGAEKKQ